MAEIIRMPRLSDTMEEGNIVSWLKKVGDAVKPGDVLAEVETDKATMELESYFNGFLLYIGVESGLVPVDGIIAIIGDKNEDFKAILKEAESNIKATKKEEVVEKKAEVLIAEPASNPTVQVALPITETETQHEGRLKASPLAKSLANQAGIDITSIAGSGDNGRIVKKDVENAISRPATSVQLASPVEIPTAKIQSTITTQQKPAYGDFPLSQMRKVIAKRLAESKFTAPHFYLTISIDMDNAISSRNIMNADGTVKISFNDFVIKASALALRQHPMINSSWMGDKITVNEEINIGVAVAVTDGLLVPVVNHADQKSLSLINNEVKLLASKAKEKKLQPQEMQGNTFTISNLGMFDIEEFTAIINPPDACILAVGSIIEKPVVKNGTIAIGNIMKVTLSCDHRVVDGATAAMFLQTLKSFLENPVKMLV